jgi:N4-gp56 family major capsid protein
MGTAWQFAAGDAETVKLWSEAVHRDAEKALFWGPMMYTAGPDDKNRLKHPDANKGAQIIRVRNEFKNKQGDRVTITNAGDLTERGVHGDGLARDSSETIDTFTMNLFFEDIVHSVRTEGPMTERRSVLEFRSTAREKLARWARRKMEGAIVLQLWGLTSWNNSGALRGWSSAAEAEVFLNTIQEYSTGDETLMYAGNASSSATVGADDVLSAQVITKAETLAFEDMDVPVEPLDINGEECLVLFAQGRGIEQLRYDDDWKAAQGTFVRDNSHPLLRRAIGKFSHTYVIETPVYLNPAANVGRSILCGKDALQMANVEDWSWFEEFEDIRKRRKVISIGAALGVAPTFFDSKRRNSLAIDHYVRS